MCKYCESKDFILEEEFIEISIVDNEMVIDLDNSKFDEGYGICINYCPICGKKLR